MSSGIYRDMVKDVLNQDIKAVEKRMTGGVESQIQYWKLVGIVEGLNKAIGHMDRILEEQEADDERD